MFTRSRRHKMISGVCAGLARQIGMNITLMRTLWVLAAAIIPGVSIWMVAAAYIILAFITPWDDEVR